MITIDENKRFVVISRVLWCKSTTLWREFKPTFTLTSLCIPNSSGLKLTYLTGDWSIHSMSLGWILRPIHILSMLVILGKRVVMKSETVRDKRTKSSEESHQFTFHHQKTTSNFPVIRRGAGDPPCSTWSDIEMSVPLSDWQSSLAYLKVTGFMLVLSV